MTIQTTTWRSGICECVIQFKWDSAVSPENRVKVFHMSLNTCAAHAAHEDLPSHLTVLQEEHRLVSSTMTALSTELEVDMSPDYKEKVKTASNAKSFASEEEKIAFEYALGEGLKARAAQFIKEFKWSFDKDRTLNISHPDLTAAKKTSLLSKLNVKNGTGKVKISGS